MSGKTRAPKGGMIGKNGEHYDGGQFLPSSVTTEKGAYNSTKKRKRMPSKAQIAPYRWVFRPSENHRPIYYVVGTYCSLVRDANGEYDINNPKIVAAPYTSYYRDDPEYAERMVEAFNKGYRWEVLDADGNCIGIE